MKHKFLSVVYHSANQSCALISSASQSSIPDLCISRVLRGEKELDFILPAWTLDQLYCCMLFDPVYSNTIVLLNGSLQHTRAKRRFAELFIILL